MVSSFFLAMPVWVWGLVGFIGLAMVVMVFWSAPANFISESLSNLLGPSFKEVGKFAGNCLRTGFGKFCMIVSFLLITTLIVWKFAVIPITESVAVAEGQADQNELALGIYQELPSIVGDKLTINDSGFLINGVKQKITAWRQDEGTKKCFQVYVTGLTKRAKIASFVSLRSMEFNVCNDPMDNWMMNRTGRTRGAFKNEIDFENAMKGALISFKTSMTADSQKKMDIVALTKDVSPPQVTPAAESGYEEKISSNEQNTLTGTNTKKGTKAKVTRFFQVTKSKLPLFKKKEKQ